MNIDTEELPHAVWSGSFNILGVKVRCHVLNDGQRVIEAESMREVLEAMNNGVPVDNAEFELLMRWQHGIRDN